MRSHKDGEIKVSYDVSGTDWQLAVSDDRSGKRDGVSIGDKSFGYSRHVCSRVILTGPPHIPPTSDIAHRVNWRSAATCLELG